ncbi:MAG TPA: hypothetical protein VLN56_02645, partial [Gammaproteobacteria bacterium]|nr:hypothetical protein [Gammaproteobacteria bacterium]
MFNSLIKKIFGSRNERILKKMWKAVDQINALEEEVKLLSDKDFPEKTKELRQRHADGETLDELIPEAFALVREAG